MEYKTLEVRKSRIFFKEKSDDFTRNENYAMLIVG